jgi:hypothetical protein
MMMIAALIALLSFIWMIARIWKTSAGFAIASFLLWPILLFAVLKYWGDEESDIKVPFAVWAVSVGYTWWATLQMSREPSQIQESAVTLLRAFA